MLVMYSYNTVSDLKIVRHTNSFYIEDLKFEPQWLKMVNRTMEDGSERPDAGIMCDDYYFFMEDTSYYAIYDNDWYPLFKGHIYSIDEFRTFYNILITEWNLCHV